MSKTPSGRVPAKVINEDIQAFHGLGTIQGYAPRPRPSPSRPSPPPYEELMADRAAWSAPRSPSTSSATRSASTEQRFHGQMRGSKDSVRGQYGDDSNELAAMGLKRLRRKSEGSGRGKPAEE